MRETRRILLVEDDENIRDVCRRYMERDGFEVVLAADGQVGWEEFLRSSPDLVVLDVMLPGKDGYQICQDIRHESDVPVMMLTARGDERDRVMGLTLGADDYLTKPFSPRELMLRVHNILRRVNRDGVAETSEQHDDTLHFDDMMIDPARRRVEISNQAADLTVKEFDVLLLMAKRPGQVFSKGQLLNLVWGIDTPADTSAVTVLMRRLREKIETNPSRPELLQTVWGIGYRFEPKTRKRRV
ncbi:response regulator transcription factor [Alicyclobacillus sp. SO9]|uniref:response regulator transcription factor n=1 Tax=Alicyclobacillus sp. SO9 TaxID=2665646 RepID=UPI0018E8E7F5|nr:response regulator transcription factor [Alicyclobacillus sp. SO9]QQE77067.1 response regulator transcription factor [Alicyclobacillus sp. SO9]